MNVLSAIALLGALACVHASGIGLGLAGSIDSAAVIAGPSGTVSRTGLASVGPIASPGAIIAGGLGHGGLIQSAVAPGAVLAGQGLGLGLGLGVGLGGIASPGLAARVLGLEGSGIEGQYIPDINEQLHDDGSYKPQIYGH